MSFFQVPLSVSSMRTLWSVGVEEDKRDILIDLNDRFFFNKFVMGPAFLAGFKASFRVMLLEKYAGFMVRFAKETNLGTQDEV